MGLDRTVRFPDGETPSWEAVRMQLSRVGESGQLRMIDGLPAFPDEDPPENWKELRLGASGGMVTLRRGSGMFVCVIWGNGDRALTDSWSRVLWACAAAGGGTIETPSGAVSEEQFAKEEGLSPA